MKLHKYLLTHKFFPLMGIPELGNDVASRLDDMFDALYGDREITKVITRYTDADGNISDEDATQIAIGVYQLNKRKWDSLITFNKEEYDPLIGRKITSTKKYGHTQDSKAGGKDSNKGSTGIYGFDSSDAVPSNTNNVDMLYGRTDNITEGGTDSTVTTVQNQSASQLAIEDIEFWQAFGLLRTMLGDAARYTTLSIYSLED